VLQPLKTIFDPADHPDLLVGLSAADDAAVYRLNDEQAIITTTDFFPPVVDDPYDFGAIAAANALSDVYAMGGRPLYAVNLVAYPDSLALDYLRDILRGGAEKVAEAGAVIAGGHSVKDQEPKYGLAVVGIGNPARIMTKAGSRPGDVLLLTKPLGSGVVTTALKRQMASDDDVAAAVASMKRLNRDAAEAAGRCDVQSMTDITGFGLLGHAQEMVGASHIDFQVQVGLLPWLPGATRYGELGAFPGGMGNNRDHFGQWVDFDSDVAQLHQQMLWTPETSGGLLLSVPQKDVEQFQMACQEATVIGRVTEGSGRIRVSED
jgi:selenide,water dikinase